jgi:hypothetical protein
MMKLSKLSISFSFKTIITLYFVIISITFSNVIIPTNKPSFSYVAYAYSDSKEQKNIISIIGTSTLYRSEQQIPQHMQNEWTSKRDNTVIIFSSYPSKIVTDKDTNLRFDVFNLSTGQYVKGFNAQITIISNKENMFKFQSLSNDKGYIIINHKFSDPGTSQIFLRMDKPSQFFSTVAAFSITTMPNENNLLNSLPIPIAFTIIALIVLLIFMGRLKVNETKGISKKNNSVNNM